jgi:hypothetical protein
MESGKTGENPRLVGVSRASGTAIDFLKQGNIRLGRANQLGDASEIVDALRILPGVDVVNEDAQRSVGGPRHERAACRQQRDTESENAACDVLAPGCEGTSRNAHCPLIGVKDPRA